MSRRRQQGSIAANPVLIGAATVLVAIVAVFLAYNANNGLPFVPSYTVNMEVPNASGLIRGNEVRIGGARVGVLTEISPLVNDDGSTGAVLTLKIQRSQPPLPKDSVLRVRPRSALGLKYVEVTRGRSKETWPDGATIPLANAAPKPVEIDEFFSMFDEPTRAASQVNLYEFGNGIAGRGQDLNTAFRGLKPLSQSADRVLTNLTAPATRLKDLFPAFEQAATEVAPVAQTQGRMWGALNQTFEAWSGVSEPLKETISLGPPALDTATRELPAQAPFVRDSTELFRRLRPAFRSLAAASPGLAEAFRVGTPELAGVPSLNQRLTRMLVAVEDFAADKRVRPGIQRLTEFTSILRPTISFIAPAQTTCNYLALFVRNLSSSFSESDVIGSFLRFGVLALPQGPNSEAGPSSAPANGPIGEGVGSLTDDSYLHSNPYPNTAAPGQERECESGNEAYIPGRQVIGNPPGNQGITTDVIEGAGKP